jgi:membrane-associated phospholipid phosphatase
MVLAIPNMARRGEGTSGDDSVRHAFAGSRLQPDVAWHDPAPTGVILASPARMHRRRRRSITHAGLRQVCAVAALMAAPAVVGAQAGNARPPDRDTDTGSVARDSLHERSPQKTFFVRRDLVATAVAAAGTAAVSSFDLRVAHWARSANVQGDSSRRNLVDELTRINETPLMLAALATYGVGRVAGLRTTADVGLHTLEALVLTTSVSQVVRGVFGRSRPRVSQEDPFAFRPGSGFTGFETRSFPSLHTAAAFATATALVGEIRVRRPGAVKVAAPLLYTAAMVPGLTRVYLDQHWASDVAAGAFVGALLGSRVVAYAHSHRRTRLDGVLLGMSARPDGRGGAMLLLNARH